MSVKQKGANAERELLHMFWANGWACLRIAGSGSMKYPSPDLLVGNKLRRLAIECKVTKDQKKYFDREQIDALRMFASIFGAEPWIAIKFKGHEWLFLSTEDLDQTGKLLGMEAKNAKMKGMLFEELLKS